MPLALLFQALLWKIKRQPLSKKASFLNKKIFLKDGVRVILFWTLPFFITMPIKEMLSH